MPKKRVLRGVKNRMPGVGPKSDYVILGPHAEWEQDNNRIPVALKLSIGQRKKVKREKFDYIARGFDLRNKLQVAAQLEYSDKSIEGAVVNVETAS